jgi:tetratricopeptide (TPR) repeat protein
VLVVLLLLAAATNAAAESKATALFAEGQRLYTAGKYLEAAEVFAAAYDLEADPVHLFNAAQAYRLGEACAKAADAYRRFMAAVPDPPEPERVHRYIDEMEACAARQRGVDSPIGIDGVPPDPTPIGQQPRPSDVGTDEAQPRDRAVLEPGDGPRSTKRVLGVAAGVAGLVSVGVGVWFTWDARFLARRYDQVCADATSDQPCDGAVLEDYDRRGRRAEKLAAAGYVVGGVAILGGITLYMLGGNERREPALSVGPTRGGAIVRTGWVF